eukprot:432496-Pyramimonas_sp.AAC.1
MPRPPTPLAAPQTNPVKQRIDWFTDVQQCRRRARKHWAATPLSLVFTLADGYQVTQRRQLEANGVRGRGVYPWRGADQSVPAVCGEGGIYGGVALPMVRAGRRDARPSGDERDRSSATATARRNSRTRRGACASDCRNATRVAPRRSPTLCCQSAHC